MRTVKEILGNKKSILKNETNIVITETTWANAKKHETVVFDNTYAEFARLVKEKNQQILNLFKKRNVKLYGFTKDKKRVEFLVANSY